MLPRLSSRVSGFPVASPCLWGKLQNLSFSKISKQVVMWLCVAGIALCDIPTCLITRRKCQDWRKSRTKCSFCSAHVSRLESLVFLWRRRVYGGNCKLSPFRRFPSRLSCRFAWQAWHFVIFQPALYRVISSFVRLAQLCAPHFSLYTLHSSLYTPHSTLYTFHSPFTLHTLHSTLHNLHFRLLTPHFTLHTLHFALHTLHSSTFHTLHPTLHHTLPRSTTLHHTLHFTHSSLHTLHSTLLSLHSTLHKLHFPLHTPQFTV